MTYINMNDTLKRYLKSTAVSFLSGFLPALVIVLENVNTFNEVSFAALIGAGFAGIRLVIKMAAEKVEGRI